MNILNILWGSMRRNFMETSDFVGEWKGGDGVGGTLKLHSECNYILNKFKRKNKEKERHQLNFQQRT